MGNMREISVQECQAVFGGTDQPEEPGTIVTAPKSYQPSTAFYDSTWAFGSAGGFGFADIADMFNSLGLEIISQFTDEDVDGDGIPNWEDDPIVVDGDRSLPTGFVEMPGGLYMYHVSSDGTRGPLEFTPWYANLVCEIYESHQQAIGQTSFQYGVTSAGISLLNPAAATAGGIMGFIAEGTGANSPPQHCPEP